MFVISICEEAQTGIVKITNFKADIIEAFVEFIHLGQIKNLDSIVVDMFKFADKYNVHELMVSLIRELVN
jgi:hypothetical protein